MKMTDNILQQILDVGIALTAEKDPNKLLNLIVETAMEMTSSDGGTLYILKDGELHFRIMKTLSKGYDRGRDGEVIDIPPAALRKENICSYAAISKESLNIADVYESDLFDFSGPKKYDEMNGYRTKSMVAIPMIDKDDEVIGVMQLINATDEAGNIRVFDEQEVRVLMALASQTAISLSNMAYVEEISAQMWSFTEAMTEAIDARTPYNASHTRKVALYSGMLVDYINKLYESGEESHHFERDHKDQIVLAAFLHDIGKMIIPIEVMNKQTRLAGHKKEIEDRLTIIGLKFQVDNLKGILSDSDYIMWQQRIEETSKLIAEADAAGFLPDDMLEKLGTVFEYKYCNEKEGEELPFFTEEEKMCLQIRKGTLTAEERSIMESHVVMTERILSKVHFNKSFAMAPVWAAQHHECINGKGYPKGIAGDDLGIEARILAVADICDALLATDRPYKKPLPKEKAFAIMEDMAANGMIDSTIVGYIEKCLA